MRPAGRPARATSATRLRAADLVRHHVARAPVILLRRVREEVRHARGVHARVLFHLRAEAGLLVSFLQERSPEGKKTIVGALLEDRHLGVHLPQPPANALHAALHAVALRLELRARHLRRRAVALLARRREVIDLPRQILETRLLKT